MASVNANLQDDAIRHAVFLQRLRTQEVKEILSLLNNEVYPDLLAEIDRRLKARMSTKRFNEMKTAYTIILREGYAGASDKLKADLKPIAINEAEFQTTLLNKQFKPFNISLIVPNINTLRALVNQDVRGQTIDKWFSNLAGNTSDEITRRLKIGLTEGDSVQRMTRRIRGTKARDFRDGVIRTSRHHSETIVRTAVTDITTKAREETYKTNDDVVKKVKWVSTLDFKTSDICQARDGQTFEVGEGPRPPAHMQCRSTTTPITKSWKELGINLAEAPPGTRSSLDGAVPADVNYPQWLRGQPKGIQEEALGVGRAAIFRRGKLPDKEIFKIRDKPLTLKEMTKLEKRFIDK